MIDFLTDELKTKFSPKKCLEIAERNGWKRISIVKELRNLERSYMIQVLNLIDRELGKHPYTYFLEQAAGEGFSKVDWDEVADYILRMAEKEDVGEEEWLTRRIKDR